MESNKLTPYTDDYKRIIFEIWYKHSRPNASTLRGMIPEDEEGRKPNKQLLSLWRDENGWDFHADELDVRAQEISDDNLVAQKVLMMKEQASRGRELQVMGMEHLRENGFDTAAAAVTAVVKGATLERESRGIGQKLLDLANMTNEEVLAEVNKLLGQGADKKIIDVGDANEKEDNTESKGE